MTNKRREDFEKLAAKHGYDLGTASDGLYLDSRTQEVWRFWFSALDSVVVDVSGLCEASYNQSDTVYRSDVMDALDKAGIKYK